MTIKTMSMMGLSAQEQVSLPHKPCQQKLPAEACVTRRTPGNSETMTMQVTLKHEYQSGCQSKYILDLISLEMIERNAQQGMQLLLSDVTSLQYHGLIENWIRTVRNNMTIAAAHFVSKYNQKSKYPG